MHAMVVMISFQWDIQLGESVLRPGVCQDRIVAFIKQKGDVLLYHALSGQNDGRAHPALVMLNQHGSVLLHKT